jgi:hypothetical protein
MRTTVRIDDALLLELKETAAREKVSLTRLLNRTLRAGLQAQQEDKRPRRQYCENTHSMGRPRVDLTKALDVASTLEDEEMTRKARLRKRSSSISTSYSTPSTGTPFITKPPSAGGPRPCGMTNLLVFRGQSCSASSA